MYLTLLYLLFKTVLYFFSVIIFYRIAEESIHLFLRLMLKTVPHKRAAIEGIALPHDNLLQLIFFSNRLSSLIS
jgi:hypothetical protein